MVLASIAVEESSGFVKTTLSFDGTRLTFALLRSSRWFRLLPSTGRDPSLSGPCTVPETKVFAFSCLYRRECSVVFTIQNRQNSDTRRSPPPPRVFSRFKVNRWPIPSTTVVSVAISS
jgi:hypothetical protein